MTAKRIHRAYERVEHLERAFTGDRETAKARAAILVEELARHEMLANAEITPDGMVVCAECATTETLTGVAGVGYHTWPPLNYAAPDPERPNRAIVTGYQPHGVRTAAPKPPRGGSSANKRDRK